jgi:hypothetical protein
MTRLCSETVRAPSFCKTSFAHRSHFRRPQAKPTLGPLLIVEVSLGHDANSMSTGFTGTIYVAYADLSDQPDVRFHVEATATLIAQVAPAKTSSWVGAVDVCPAVSSRDSLNWGHSDLHLFR